MVLLGFELSSSFVYCIFTSLLVLYIAYKFISKAKIRDSSKPHNKSQPLVSSFWDFFPFRDQHIQWTANFVAKSPTSTFTFYYSPFHYHIITADPENVKHILKDRFDIYQKDSTFKLINSELLGDGIFNTDGHSWKLQRRISSHEFNTKSLRKFVEHVVNIELTERLIPILETAAKNRTILDFQDILQRFTLDTICKIAFGYDPMYLLPSLPKAKFAVAYDEAVEFSQDRFFSLYPIIWKFKRFFNMGSEKKLKIAVDSIREFARKVINDKKRELNEKTKLESVDLLSRFLSTGHDDEKFVSDIIINFVLAGRDTTSAGMTWFFWLISKNKRVESEILKEIKDQAEKSVYEEVKEMVYTHASLSESMRLYPPVPVDTKLATKDDILPSGLKVKKGETVAYHNYAMGRSKELWGMDWGEFRPERWLNRDGMSGNWRFEPKDPFIYPIFQAGPRICLGKDMAYLQMKRVVAEVLRRFKVVPALENGAEPVLVSFLTVKMRDGFPVRIEKREE